MKFPASDEPLSGPALPLLPVWRLEEPKVCFSDLARRGLQGVTVKEQGSVVVLSAAEYSRLASAAPNTSLGALFGESPFARLDDFDEALARERSLVRNLSDF